jgi:hypothetical protein
MAEALKLENCVNDTCPWSGWPVQGDSLTVYRGRVAGFCNTGCRDKFEAAATLFDNKIDKAAGRHTSGHDHG